MLDQVLTIIQPAIVEILAAIIAAAFAMASLAIRRYAGAKAESAWRDAVHRAMQSGVSVSDGQTAAEIAKDAVEYVKRSVPGALSSLGAKPDVLADLAYGYAKREVDMKAMVRRAEEGK